MMKRKQTSHPKQKRKRGPRGQVGPQTYADVRKIVDAKGIPLVRAFEEVAKATGRKASTIAVTYYTIARKQGAGRAPKVKAAGRRGGGRPTSVKTILSAVSTAIAKLETMIEQQAKEIERLRGESRLADRIRSVLRG
ncbi:MAG TPA: hypothetical protein VMT89_08970 [Candidatus Acidoferrales bacterium]|nr:hypothetical protein [Candidatus Acidoferrales bacterium]